MAPWTRASELHRSVRCPASAVLPRGPDRPNAAADFGTEVHAYVSGGEPTARVRAWLDRQGVGDVRGVYWPGGAHDVLLGLATAHHEGVAGSYQVKADRDVFRATLPADYVAGEADWLSLDGPVPWVDDLKTGWHPGEPTGMEQTKFYGLAALRASPGAPSAVMLSITHWPADGAQPPLRVTRLATREGLEQWWEGEVVPAARLALGPTTPTPTPGEHCYFCPCVSCPYNYESNQGDNR